MKKFLSSIGNDWRPLLIAGLMGYRRAPGRYTSYRRARYLPVLLVSIIWSVLATPTSYATPQLQSVAPVTTTKPGTNAALEKGLQLLASEEWAAALAAFATARQQFTQTKDRPGEAESWLYMGDAHLRLEEYAAAQQAYTSALTLAEALADKELTGATFDGMGALYLAQHRVDAALNAYQRALRIWRATGATDKTLHTLTQLSTLYTTQEKFTEAQQAAAEALTLASQLGDITQEQALRQQNADLHKALALQSYQEELAIWRALADQTQEGTTLHNIGLLLQTMEQYNEALITFNDERLLWRALDNRAAEAEAYYSLAVIYILTVQTAPALDTLDRALVTAQAAGDQRLQAKILSKQGDLYQTTADYAAALAA